MPAVYFLAIFLAGWAACGQIAALSHPPAVGCNDDLRPVNFRKAVLAEKFRPVKMVSVAALDTLSRQEADSGAVPKPDWLRLKNYLASFQRKYPDFHSELLDNYLTLATAKSE